MKTYKQLKEEWIASGTTTWNTSAPKFNIYKNASGAELRALKRTFRGFIDNNDVYIADNGIHGDIIIKIQSEVSNKKNLIPFVATKFGKGVTVEFGDFVYNTNWAKKLDAAAEIITNHRWFNMRFMAVTVDRKYL